MAASPLRISVPLTYCLLPAFQQIYGPLRARAQQRMPHDAEAVARGDILHFFTGKPESIFRRPAPQRGKMPVACVELIVGNAVVGGVNHVADNFSPGVQSGPVGTQKTFHVSSVNVIQPVDRKNGVHAPGRTRRRKTVILPDIKTRSGLA